jgi:hypothetical protein
MMHTLTELKDHLLSLGIEIKEFNGWLLKVGDDTWVLDHGVFYKNGYPQSLKDKNIFEAYDKADKLIDCAARRSKIKMIKSAKFIVD